MNTDDALLFVRLAECLSFKDAASQLGISRSAASKRIALLERSIGARLVNRTPRSISLTHAGGVLLEHCRIICAAMEGAQQAIHGHGLQPVGTLQIALPTVLGRELLSALLSEFVASYRKLTLSIHLFDGEIDVIGGGYDVAFVVASRLADSNLRAQRVVTTHYVLAASPGYLRQCDAVGNARDIAKHRCLGIGYAATRSDTWRFICDKPIEVGVRYSMTFNSYQPLVSAACQDMGFIYVPALYIRQELARGQLRAVLPEQTQGAETALYALYPNRKPPEKVSALVDFVKPRISESVCDTIWEMQSAH